MIDRSDPREVDASKDEALFAPLPGIAPIRRRGRALEIEAQRFRIAYALAEELDISTENFGHSGCSALLDLLPALEAASAASSPTEAAQAIRSTRIDIMDHDGYELTRVIGVLYELGWDRFSPPLRVESLGELYEVIRERLDDPMQHRLGRMLDAGKTPWVERGPSPGGNAAVGEVFQRAAAEPLTRDARRWVPSGPPAGPARLQRCHE